MVDPELTVTLNDAARSCHVAVQWQDGRAMKVGEFRTAKDAQAWIDEKSSAWLAALPQRSPALLAG